MEEDWLWCFVTGKRKGEESLLTAYTVHSLKVTL